MTAGVIENAVQCTGVVCIVRYSGNPVIMRDYHCTNISFFSSLNQYRPNVWEKQIFAGRNLTLVDIDIWLLELVYLVSRTWKFV